MTEEVVSQSGLRFSDYRVRVQVSKEGHGQEMRSTGLYHHK